MDPGGENFREKTEKSKENGRKLQFYYKILTICGQTPLFITFEQSLLSISTLHNVICYKMRIQICIFQAAGSRSGSTLRRTAGSGSLKNECGSTALVHWPRIVGQESVSQTKESVKLRVTLSKQNADITLTSRQRHVNAT